MADLVPHFVKSEESLSPGETDLSDENRTRLLDWMIQVFRVVENSSPSTFFVAASLLDRYF
jgi:hypothetical protein